MTLTPTPDAPTWRTDGLPLPMDCFGKDHWSTFAYVETRAVDHDGLLGHDQMRCNGLRHPMMLAAKGPAVGNADARDCPTIIKSAQPPVDGHYGRANVPQHDDYDCLSDLIAAGLLEPRMPQVGPQGWYVNVHGDMIHSGDGEPIRPGFLTGMGELILCRWISWKLTPAGVAVASQLRAHKADRLAFHDFVPDLPATS